MSYNLKIIYSGKHRAEVYYSKDYNIQTDMVRNPNGKNGKGDITTEQKEKNSKRARVSHLNTIRNNIVRLGESNSNYFKSFITLTYSSDVTEAENTRNINLFLTKLRQKYKDLKFIWVIERTKKGRIHIHMLTSIEFKNCISGTDKRKTKAHKEQENEFEKLWSYKKRILGFVDVRSLENNADKHRSIMYLTSYINKSFAETELEKCKHLWGYSIKTLEKPVIEKFEAITNIEDILKDFNDYYNMTYCNSYPLIIDGEQVGIQNYFDFYIK